MAVGPAEQPPRLVRGEIRDHLRARDELVGDAREGVGLHDRRHDLAVDGQRHVDRRALDHRRPVLIAQRVAQLDAGSRQGLLVLRRASPSSWMTRTSCSLMRATIAVASPRPRPECRRRAGACSDPGRRPARCPPCGLATEAVLLRLPLVESQLRRPAPLESRLPVLVVTCYRDTVSTRFNGDFLVLIHGPTDLPGESQFGSTPAQLKK